MSKEITGVGIDVAKATLDICLRYNSSKDEILHIRNNYKDFTKKVLPKLKNYKGKIILESTGHYHWTPTLILSENDYDVYVVNPILAKKYTKSNVRGTKSDPADASALATMSIVEKNMPEPFSGDPESLWLRKKLGLIASVSKQIQALKGSINSIREAQEMVSGCESKTVCEFESIIKELENSKKNLENECILDMEKDSVRRDDLKLLTSIPGISPFVATLFLHWFKIFDGVTPGSWTAYAGLDVSVRESGTWKGVSRLTKRGNSFLRKRVFSSAWGAWMHNEMFKRYYTVLREERGRSHNEALVIIARKLIHVAFVVLKTKTPYDENLCFKEFSTV